MVRISQWSWIHISIVRNMLKMDYMQYLTAWEDSPLVRRYLKDKGEALLHFAKRAGGKDNITIVILEM